MPRIGRLSYLKVYKYLSVGFCNDYTGVSKIKQAWSLGSPFKLLVRDFICCCMHCILKDFDNCLIKVGIILKYNLLIRLQIVQEYVEHPREISFTSKRIYNKQLRSKQTNTEEEEDNNISSNQIPELV